MDAVGLANGTVYLIGRLNWFEYMQKINRCSLIIGLVLAAFSAFANDIQVLGLFKDKVVLEVGGKTHTLNVGQEIAGMKLLSANSQQCVLQINGQSQVFTMGSQVNINFVAPALFVRIVQDSHGLYRAPGTINGQAVNFLIDTGASMVAMNMNQAKELGIAFEGKPVIVETASGKARAFFITLQKLTIGEIHVYDIPAVVIESDSPREVLLGRSFLTRVDMKDQNHILEMRQKY